MKRLSLIFFIILPAISVGQYQSGFLQEYFFGRQPSARAEAMGKAYASIDSDMTTLFYNPAGIASIKGLEINGSLASPYYSFDEATYSFISAGYKFNDYLVIGLTRNHFTSGGKITFTDIDGNVIKSYTPYNSNYSLTLASQPIKNLFFGLNTNYFIWQPLDEVATSIYFDFGIIKKIQLLQEESSDHSINIGASISNLNYAKIKLDFFGNKTENDFPVITRYGANYHFALNKQLFSDSLKTLEFLYQLEYQMLLNSDYHSAIRTGGELKILEILSLRVGYFSEKVEDYDIPTYNNSEISSVTYGFGLQLPVHKFTNIPLNINFDYTNLSQPSYSKTFTNWDNFSVYNLRINWII
ncbi:hypothetical protein ACFLQ9_00890 [Bacteroidota bacterium]